jgi:archaellum biogenesis protein FlaJ (TadC family)
VAGMESYIWWISGASLLSAVATLLAIPWVVARLPADYFHHSRRENWRGSQRASAVALLFGVVKNLLGAVLLVLGVVMLFIPGQGLLTILVGLLLMNFPGKYRLERWLVQRPGVLRSLNWLRKRHGRPPFRVS